MYTYTKTNLTKCVQMQRGARMQMVMNQTESKGSVENKEEIQMKQLVSLVLALMLCLSCVSALAAEAWTVTCP